VDSRALDGLLRSVEMCYIHRDLVGALQAVEQARLLDADQERILKYSASLNLSRGLQLLERGEAVEAGPHLFRAAQDMRRLQEKSSPLDSGGLRYLAETTYYAGMMHARQGDADQAVLCLEQSLAEGSFPVSAEEVARDYALLHDNPALQAVLDKLSDRDRTKLNVQ